MKSQPSEKIPLQTYVKFGAHESISQGLQPLAPFYSIQSFRRCYWLAGKVLMDDPPKKICVKLANQIYYANKPVVLTNKANISQKNKD